MFGVDDPHPRGQIIKEAPKTEIEKTGNLQSLSKKGPGRPGRIATERARLNLARGGRGRKKKLSLFSPPPGQEGILMMMDEIEIARRCRKGEKKLIFN